MCSKAERLICAVVARQKLEIFRAMQEDLSGKMICRDRPPSHDLLPSVVCAISSDVYYFSETVFRPSTFDAIKQPSCLEPALSMRPRCFEYSVGMAFLLGAPRCPHHHLDRCLGWNVRMVGLKISCGSIPIFTCTPASCTLYPRSSTCVICISSQYEVHNHPTSCYAGTAGKCSTNT